jgi:hypothetical protein
VRWLLIPLLLLMTWFGQQDMDAAIWYDEWFSVRQAGGGNFGPLTIGEVWQHVMEDVFETPAHYILLSEWGKLVGWTEYAARALSLLLGLLAASWMYRLGRDLFSPLVGLSAATIFGMSALYLYHMHQMRTYTLLALLSIVVVWCYWRVIQSPAARWKQAALVLSTTALLYTHYMGALIPAALALYHLIFVRKDRHWWAVVGLFALALLLFVVPWFGEIYHTVTHAGTNEERQMLGLSTPELLTKSAYQFGNASIAFAALFIIAAAVVRGKNTRFVWAVTLGALGLAVLVNTLLPVLRHARYLMPLWPLLALLMGLGVGPLHARRIHAGLTLGVWMIAGAWLSISPEFSADIRGGAYADLPWHTLVDTLDARSADEDVIAYHRPDNAWAIEEIFDYYLDHVPGRRGILELLPGRDDNNEFLREAELFIGDAPRVWLVTDKIGEPNFRLEEIRLALASGYEACGTVFDLPAMKLDLYAREPSESPAFTFGEGIGLYMVEPVPAVAADTLSLTLGWMVSEDVPPHTYSVGVHVDNAAGQLVTQADYPLPEEGYHCPFVQLDLRPLTPGEYQVRVVVYDFSTGTRLTDDQGNDRPLLGSVTRP